MPLVATPLLTRLLIDTQNGTGASGTITLTVGTVSSVYKRLIVEIVGRSDTAASTTSARLTINGSSTAADYNAQIDQGNAASASASEAVGSVAYIFAGYFPGATSTASWYGHTTIEIPEFANTSVFRSVLLRSPGGQNAASGGITVASIGGVYESTTAVSTLGLVLAAGNWTAATVARLYAER